MVIKEPGSEYLTHFVPPNGIGLAVAKELHSFLDTPLEPDQFPCHSQAVERYVREMTEISGRVMNKEKRDSVMRAKLLSRKISNSICK